MKKALFPVVLFLSMALILALINDFAGRTGGVAIDDAYTEMNDELAEESKSAHWNSQGDINNGDRDVIATQISVNEIYGYLPRGNLSFLIQSGWDVHAGPTANGEIYGKRMTKIEFYLGEKTLLVQAGGGELYIKGFTTSTGVLTPLTTGEKRLLKDALEHSGNIKLGEHADLFLSSLNALSSWPKNMLVFIWQDGDKAMSAVGNDRLATTPRKDFNARNTDAVTLVPLDRQAIEDLTPPVLDMTATDVRESAILQSVTTICFAIGHKYTGRYFECDDPLCIGRTNHRIRHCVGATWLLWQMWSGVFGHSSRQEIYQGLFQSRCLCQESGIHCVVMRHHVHPLR